MRVSGLFSRLLLVGAASCLGASACARPAPVAPVAITTAAAPGSVAPASVPAPPPGLHDVSWQLRSGDGSPWTDAPPALHTFTVGRWECALSEVLSDDMLGADELDLRRTRRLACTHATGATVQTQLACTLHTARAQRQAPVSGPGARAQSAASTDVRSAARELQLQLDATPPLHVRCAPIEVTELALISRDKRQLAVLCLDPGGIRECAASAGPVTSGASTARTVP
jgi:hypothetical protein